MSTHATQTEAIKRTVTVDCPVEHAFATFTERIHEWWPLGTHSIEAGEGGTRRIYRLDPDGLGELRDYFDDFWSEALAAFKALAEDERRNG